MPFFELLPGFLVAFSFYSFYSTLFPERPGLRLPAIAFFFSASAAGSSILQEEVLNLFLDEKRVWVQAFLLSSLPEEFSKFLFLYLYFRLEKIERSLSEGIFYGIIFGLFFGLIENAFYSMSLGIWPMLVRSTTALPLHMLTSGILGGFILNYLNSNPRSMPYIELVQGFLVCFVLHGAYNFCVFSSGRFLYGIPPVLLLGFVLLEYGVMKSQNTLPRDVLSMIGLKWDDYEIVRRFRQHLNWMDVDQERFQKRDISIIKIPRISVLFTSTILFLVGFGFYAFLLLTPEKIISTFKGIQFPEYISIFVFYPIFTGFSLSFSGSLNPEYFRYMILRIPIFISVHIRAPDYEETSVVFFLSRKGFYVPLLNPSKFNGKISVDFWIAGKTIGNIYCEVYWKDMPDEDREGGALVQFLEIPWKLIFWWKFILYKQRLKNLIPKPSILT